MKNEKKGEEKGRQRWQQLGPNAYVGWRTELLAYLKESLKGNEITETRTRLLLAMVARLPLNPRNGWLIFSLMRFLSFCKIISKFEENSELSKQS